MKHPFTLAALMLPAFLSGMPAEAATTVYTDRDSFLAALAASYEDDFNDIPSGHHAAPMNRGDLGFSYTIRVFDENWWERGVLGTYQAGGSTALGTPSSYNNIEFVFQDGGVNAFGGYFWGTDYMGELYNGSEMEFDLSDGTSYTLSNISNISTFVGFITDGPTWQWIDINSFPDRPTFDNLIVGSTAVPEPSGVLLSALGSAVLLRRKRR